MTSRRRWLVLEPYFGGSHRQLVEGIDEHVGPDRLLWTLPARKWKWRMRGSALEFGRRLAEERPAIDAIFASSLMNAAELRGILPPDARSVPLVVYFHENQLRYPVQSFDKRDHHFAWTNLHSALAADKVLWNSAYNRDSFLEDLAQLARRMPDVPPHWAVDAVAARSEVLPVPIDTEAIDAALGPDRPARDGPCHVVWNHRWEFDKGPERLLEVVDRLASSGLVYRFSVLGQAFQETPALFDRIRERLGSRCDRWGTMEDRRAYLRCLGTADVVLSTARHEFQGVAVLEAAACGAVPLVPDDLAYREIWPAEWRCAPAALADRLVERVRDVDHWRGVDPRPIARGYGWAALGPRWRGVFEVPPPVADGPLSTHA